MKVLDPGHSYMLRCLDPIGTEIAHHGLQFVKREGENYPGNVGTACGVTNQEVLRALIDRLQYLQAQKPCVETAASIELLRTVLVLHEVRAARVKDSAFVDESLDGIEHVPVCDVCGHLYCGIVEHRK